MLTCKELAEKLSSDVEMSLIERAEAKLHLLICRSCVNYKKHLDIISKNFSRWFEAKYDAKPEDIKRLEDSALKKLD